MGRSSAARSEETPDRPPAAGDWTTSWAGTPPEGWDEVRGRMRVLRGGATHGGHGHPTPALELLEGPQPARVSWRRAEPGVGAAVGAVELWLHRMAGRLWSPSWWREHQPLTVQRILVLILVMQALLVALQLR
jgi:hypothetical protein